ncbi:hypothetical protein [Streptomyces dysideae]|uniref:hypothetical protein n=1 Tax=Streptomyces dysideae TaxID=909626 RepID=UPI00131DB54E|nr:hypothetical protein [Streptomyces dysideae]
MTGVAPPVASLAEGATGPDRAPSGAAGRARTFSKMVLDGCGEVPLFTAWQSSAPAGP